MKKTKRLLKIALALFLTITTTLPLIGCVRINKPSESGNGTSVVIPGDVPELTYSLIIEERKTFYYPHFSGKIVFEYFPERITVCVENQECDITPKSVIYAPNYYGKVTKHTYIMTFDEDVIFSKLHKGNKVIKIFGYKDGEKIEHAEKVTSTVYVCKDMSGVNMIDFQTGEIILAMDLDSNWIGPY